MMKQLYSFIRDAFKNLDPRLDDLTKEAKTKFKAFHFELEDFRSKLSKYNIHVFEIMYIDNELVCYIELEHPGILIGKEGKNIDALSKFIGYPIKLKIFDIWI